MKKRSVKIREQLYAASRQNQFVAYLQLYEKEASKLEEEGFVVKFQNSSYNHPERGYCIYKISWDRPTKTDCLAWQLHQFASE